MKHFLKVGEVNPLPILHAPFIVFAMPRSRSAWLSVLLRLHTQRPVGHDTGIECASPDEFVERLGDLAGTVETGAAFAWPLIRQIPDARFAVVLHDPEAVTESLERRGLHGYGDEMLRRYDQLLQIATEPGVLSLRCDSLARYVPCAEIVMHCTGQALEMTDWIALDAMNIQVDMPRRIERLQANRERIAALKSAIAQEAANA